MKKMIKKILTLFSLSIICFFSPAFSYASLLDINASDKKIENQSLIATATAPLAGTNTRLTEIGAGIRSKKILFVNIQVYIGELLVSDPTNFNKMDLLSSAVAQKSIAMRLTFLRSVDFQKILSSFEEAFKTNSIDAQDPHITELIKIVRQGGDIEKGQTLSILGYKKDTAEIVAIEDARGKITEVSGPTGFIRQVFSLWLGKPADSGIENFQHSLVK